MLKRKYRLTLKTKKTFSQSLNASFFTVKLKKNELPHNRYGIVVSKKIDKRAVMRNTIKRRVRACIEEVDARLQKGYDMLFIMRKNILAENNTCSAVEDTLQKAKLLV